MSRKDAKAKAQGGCFAGDLKKILDKALTEAPLNAPAKINKNLHKSNVLTILTKAVASYADLETVNSDIAWKVLYEFG